MTFQNKKALREVSTEKLIKEILSKICPFHGKRPIVDIHETGQIKISACCKEFQEFLEKIVKNKVIDTGGSSSEIIKDNQDGGALD